MDISTAVGPHVLPALATEIQLLTVDTPSDYNMYVGVMSQADFSMIIQAN